MKKIALALALAALSAGTADAGPLRDRLKARFCRPCATCQQAPAVAFPAAPPAAGVPLVGASLTYAAGSCPGGVCPAPVRLGR